jgi:hypothetical protein
MECELKNRNELITSYLLGEISDTEAKVFEEHYFECDLCFKELRIAEDALKLIVKDGKTIFEPEVHPNLTESESKSYEKKYFNNIRKLIFPELNTHFRWAIAFTSIAVLAIIFFFLFQEKQSTINEKVITNNEETILENQDDLTADTLNKQVEEQNKNDFAELTGPEFEAMPYFEEWISENVRSQNNKVVSVFSPTIGEKFYNREIIFHLKLNRPSNGIIIKIMNNLEKEIYISALNGQLPEFTFKATPDIFKQSGLYYWRIEDENDVLFIGKFYFLVGT